MPVLTAHPTEVQRKSTLDEHREIAQALAHRDATLTPEELAEIDATLLGRVATLWQTRMLRYTRLTVADEIENALSYYRSTFLQAIPRLYGDLSRLLNRESAKPFAAPPPPLEPFLRMGSWIGGDRDGNPNVDAGTLERALLRQATVLFEHYLQEVHSAGRGPVHDHAADCRRPGPAGAGRPQRRRFPAPRRRALPPRAGRRVRPPGRHRPGPDRPEPGPPQHRGGPGL